ncbi:hypothetical protein [Pedobacter sp. GR22-10]|uniref:hypothetical protein n=1 Tax=Pedobacter sp. GR22-10 TaxID=2994472 RepID=UPI002246F351|nr:hypothetical protein [Pedobacter sp. GR22-10]MCX2429882.1 hypothetical protein [Pedobacter sp. GR22-10]
MIATSTSISEKISSAGQLEKAGDLKGAEDIYLNLLKKNKINIVAYSRLMVIYRKQKFYRKELIIINKAIKSYLEQQKSEQKDWIAENKKAACISMGLAKALGLLTAKGHPSHDDPIIAAWKKRRENLQKKMKD